MRPEQKRQKPRRIRDNDDDIKIVFYTRKHDWVLSKI